MKIKFKRYWRPDEVRRGVTPRRLAAARRVLQKEQEKLPLFAEAIAEQQPTPEARVLFFDDRAVSTTQSARKRRAQGWKRARTLLRSMCDKERASLLWHWNRSAFPKDPSYLLDLIHQWNRGWRPKVLSEEDFKKFEEGRKRVDELLARWEAEGKLRQGKYGATAG